MANVGRPLKFGTVEELQAKMVKYFNDTPMEEWTITGLALALDTSRETLINYQERPEFFDTIKKGKDMVEHSYEVDLKKSGRTGTIFALKNFDWKDKNEQEFSTKDDKPLNISWMLSSPTNPDLSNSNSTKALSDGM